LQYLLKPVRKPDSFEEFEAPVGFILLEYLKPNERFRTHAFRLYLVFKERFIPELSRRQRLTEKIKSLREANRNYTPFSYSVNPYLEEFLRSTSKRVISGLDPRRKESTFVPIPRLM
jgi:hypothetical protein